MWRLWIVLYFFVSSDVFSQDCNTSRPSSTPTDNYFINDDGTITDIESGLVWMRCAVGQTWNGKSCSGEPQTFTWRQAFKKEDVINQNGGYAGLHNWRLPALNEIAMIVERQCNSPRINLELFPATPSAAFWTANHKSGAIKRAFAMDFDREGLMILRQGEKLYLRLVSGRD